ncbi:MAG: hypothetical protein KC635_04180, partial [Myxococcales bacterium]|nr:hypothetical protein [Myxococcales bacterium]
MRRATPLSFLTPGRCFTLAEPASLLDDDAEGAGGFRYGKSILQPGMVFKVVPDDADGDDVAVESAAGESTRFPKTASVVEVPREGFERLAAR